MAAAAARRPLLVASPEVVTDLEAGLGAWRRQLSRAARLATAPERPTSYRGVHQLRGRPLRHRRVHGLLMRQSRRWLDGVRSLPSIYSTLELGGLRLLHIDKDRVLHRMAHLMAHRHRSRNRTVDTLCHNLSDPYRRSPRRLLRHRGRRLLRHISGNSSMRS